MPLSVGASTLHCERCAAAFSIEGGVPKLYPPSRAAQLENDLALFHAPHPGLRNSRLFRALIPPDPVFDYGRAHREARVRAKMGGGLVLNLGSKSAQWDEHVVNIDISTPAGGGVDLLADIHKLPFADGSVDGVICTYVLEHVADARACIDEIARVVKPGGYVYVTVPFLFPTHPDPLDRWRWTLDGLRYSLRAFEELEAGGSGGPFSAYVSITPTLVASVFSNFVLFNATRFVLGWLLWPVKFVDCIASRSDKAYMAAANFYFLGKKR